MPHPDTDACAASADARHRARFTKLLPRVRPIAHRIHRRTGRRMDLGELLSVGYAALHDALHNFDPARAKLEFYVDRRIEWAMRDAVRGEVKRRLEQHPHLPPTANGRRKLMGQPARNGSVQQTLRRPPLEATCRSVLADRRVDRRRRRATIRRAVAELDPRERAVIEDHYFGGRRFNEVAKRGRVSPSQISRRHTRALGQLRRILQRHGITAECISG